MQSKVCFCPWVQVCAYLLILDGSSSSSGWICLPYVQFLIAFRLLLLWTPGYIFDYHNSGHRANRRKTPIDLENHLSSSSCMLHGRHVLIIRYIIKPTNPPTTAGKELKRSPWPKLAGLHHHHHIIKIKKS